MQLPVARECNLRLLRAKHQLVPQIRARPQAHAIVRDEPTIEAIRVAAIDCVEQIDLILRRKPRPQEPF